MSTLYFVMVCLYGPAPAYTEACYSVHVTPSLKEAYSVADGTPKACLQIMSSYGESVDRVYHNPEECGS